MTAEQKLNENPLIAKIVAGAIVDKITSKDDEELQQENALLLAKAKNLATKKNFNTLKNKVTTKIKGNTAQKVMHVANKVKNKPKPIKRPKNPKKPKPIKPNEPNKEPSKVTQHVKKSTQAIAKGIISALNGK